MKAAFPRSPMFHINAAHTENLRQKYLLEQDAQFKESEDVLFADFKKRIEQMERGCQNSMVEKFIRTGTYATPYGCSGIIRYCPTYATLKARMMLAYPHIELVPKHICTDSDCCLHRRSGMPNKIEFTIHPEHFGVSDKKQ